MSWRPLAILMLSLSWIAAISTRSDAAEYFVSATGRTNAVGSISDPLDLATAINISRSPVLPGDTLWVRGGRYIAPLSGYVFNLSGTAARPIIFRNYQGERAMIDGTFKAHGRYVWYWGLEFTTLTEYLPATLTRSDMESRMLNGTYSFSSFYLEAATYSRFINNIFHDSYGQIEYGVTSSNSMFYGNIVLNMGQQCSNNERGVGLYTQNQNGTREIIDNVFGQNILNGVDIWSSGNSFINNYTVDGNICFNNGYGRLQGGRNLFSGAGNGCTNLLMVSNILYYSSGTANKPNLKIGHGGSSYNPTVRDNLLINGGFEMSESFGRTEVTGNELLSTSLYNNMHILWPKARNLPFNYIFARNRYYNRMYLESTVWITNSSYPTGTYVRMDVPNGFTGWNNLGASFPSVGSNFHPDTDGYYTLNKPTGTRVVIRPNRFEAGRAHIAVMNFDLQPYVDVDVSSLYLPNGITYEIHPIQNLYNQTNIGIYNGGSIRIPMTNWGMRLPRNVQRGESPAISNSFPQFGVFLFKVRGSSDIVDPPPTITRIPDQTTDEDTLSNPITFEIGDPQVPASALVVSAVSSNTTLVPNQNLILSGTGAQRTLRVQPATNRTGVVSIAVSVTDGFSSSNTIFRLTVQPVNDPPTISAVADQAVAVGTPTAYLSTFIGDVETDATLLTLTASSSNPGLIPVSGVALTGTAWSRTIRVTPVAGLAGQSVVTLTVSDGSRSTSTSFTVTVGSLSTAPRISEIGNQTTRVGQPIYNIPFTLTDPNTSLGSVTLRATSSNLGLIPNNNLVLTGSGGSRFITVTPTPGATGSSVISVSASDGTTSVTESFNVVVEPGNNPPTLTSLADATILQNGSLGPLNVTLGDVETPVGSLAFGLRCLTPTLFPDGNIAVTGTGANRSLTLNAAFNEVGTATLLMWVSDGALAVTNSFRVTVQPSALPPVLSGPTSIVLDEDVFTTNNLVRLVVSDPDTPIDLVNVTVTSDNLQLIPLETLEMSVDGSERWLTLIPGMNLNGEAVLTVTADDGENLRHLTIPITVRPTEDAPSIASVSDVTLPRNTWSDLISLSVSDPDLEDALVVTAWADNATLVPAEQMQFSGLGTNRTFTFLPGLDLWGTTQVHVAVSDGVLSNMTSFRLTVSEPNDPPSVNAGTNAAVLLNANFFLWGRVSDDGHPTVPGRVSVVWSQVSGPGTVTFGTPQFAVTSARFSAPGFYVVRLTATDGQLTNSDDTVIFARVNTDTVAPVISQLEVGDIEETRLAMRWTTSELADRQVEYTPAGGTPLNTFLSPSKSTNHTVVLTNLVPGLTYTVKARSRDAVGNRGVSPPLRITTRRPTLFYTAHPALEASIVSPLDRIIDNDGVDYLITEQADSGAASLPFYAPVSSTCYIWARVWSATESSDSFYVSVDDGPEDVFDAGGEAHAWTPSWHWTVLNGRGGVGPLTIVPRTFQLPAGLHQLKIRGREAGCRLAKILVTNDPDFVPSDDQVVADTDLTALDLQGMLLGITVVPGWSMVGNPLLSGDARVGSVLLNPLPGVSMYQFDPDTQQLVLASTYQPGGWIPSETRLEQGQCGLLYNPYTVPLRMFLHGNSAPDTTPLTLGPGYHAVSPKTVLGGKLTDLLAYTFLAGDSVSVVEAATGALRTYHFDGTRWNVVPTLNPGEGVILNIPTR